MIENVVYLDADRALELMREVVVEFGEDYVYPAGGFEENLASCVYVRDGQCSCLVGHVLHRAGATLEQLQELDNAWDPEINRVEFDWLRLTEDARHALTEAQDEQDQGHTWGDALTRATSSLSEA